MYSMIYILGIPTYVYTLYIHMYIIYNNLHFLEWVRRVTSMNFCGHILETLADFYYFLKMKDFSTSLAHFNSIEKLR